MNNPAPVSQPNTNGFTAIKQKQQQTWGSGDYGRIGVTLQIVGEQLCESLDMRAGKSVLDVAGGNGNASLAAARRFTQVTCTDYVQALFEEAHSRAVAEGLAIDVQFADAERLPFEADSFDYVISTFGVMFAPDQETSAKEMLRVCKHGGHIGLVNWTPHSFIGQLLKTVGSYVAPPAGVKPPVLWGTPEFLQAHFGMANAIDSTERNFVFRYESPAHWLDVFAKYYGPTHKALLTLDEANANSLRNDILRLIAQFNVAEDGTMVVPSSYLETIVRV